VLEPGVGEFLITYPNLPLLTGEYFIYALLFDESFKNSFWREVKKFTVISNVKDHGIIFMEHKWILEI
jgi:hypothetical protein